MNELLRGFDSDKERFFYEDVWSENNDPLLVGLCWGYVHGSLVGGRYDIVGVSAFLRQDNGDLIEYTERTATRLLRKSITGE